ncbi:hypothetical protein NIES4102_02580 [Chondrocystis sp. NIES-4102]|nr:hypothetical protein NIES4102_02580 [Chondrocystis sp. NIES-4102]
MNINRLSLFEQFSHHRQSLRFLIRLVTISSAILFFFSSLQLALFRAGNDLAFFDQFLYLLSRGQTPISTLLEGVHLIGDHGAIILYPLSWLYIIYPSVYWLLLVQAIALSCGAIPVYALSRSCGLKVSYCRAVAICYVLYPALFNINFYTEFRPETIAVPALIWAVLAIKKRKIAQGAIALVIVLSCKETMSFTVIGLGFWLLLKRRFIYAFACIITGLSWFLFAAIYLIPTFRGGQQMAGTWHYESLGNSLPAIALKIVSEPQIFLIRSLAGDRLFYYLLLVLPIIFGLHWRKIAAIIPALPMLGLNILADFPRQRDLIHQYSLPIIPFLFVWLIASLVYLQQHQLRSWLTPRRLIIWSIIAFMALGKYGYFWTRYAPLYSNIPSVNGAINLISPNERVLTSGYVAPHLSHRPQIMLLRPSDNLALVQDNQLDTVLIAFKHLGTSISPQTATQFMDELKTVANFKLVYHQQDVFLLKLQDN